MFDPCTCAPINWCAPPLMGQFMRGDEVSQVDVVFVQYPPDETNAFGERHGIGKRLRESPVARELHDPILCELIRADNAPDK